MPPLSTQRRRSCISGLTVLLAWERSSDHFRPWTGWGLETDPAAQLLRDAPWVALAGLTGAGAGAVLTWAVIGRHGMAVAVGAAVGALPAAVMVTAYFTDAY